MDANKNQSSLEEQQTIIDPAMLTSVVRRMMRSETVEVVEHPQQQILEGGAVGMVVRLTGIGRDQSKRIPWSLILKFVPAPGSAATKFVKLGEDSTQFNYWRRELLVYDSGLLLDLPDGLTAPKYFHHHEQADGYWLWLEDIEDSFGRPWPVRQYGVAAQHLGRFNGQYLVKREIPSYSWLVPFQQHARSAEKRMLESDILSRLPALREQHAIVRQGWPNRLVEEFQAFWLQREVFFQALDRLPKIVMHGDTGHRNLFARTRADGTAETVAIDWSNTGIGSIGEDLTQLVASTALWFGIPLAQLSELDQVVFEGYLQGLYDVGWHGKPDVVRLGYVAYTALHYGLIATSPLELMALDEQERRRAEKMFGHSMEEVTDNLAAARQFVIACANEARKLMDLV